VAGALLAFAWAMASEAGADTVYLKGGGKVSGEIVEKSESGVVLEVGPGRVSLARTRILRIEESASPLAEYRDRARQLQPRDLEGWLDLGRWATAEGLPTQAAEAYAQVLKLQPGNAEANQGVGRVEVNGQWLSHDDAQRARGLVEFEGRWVSPSERAALARQRSQETEAEAGRREGEARIREAEARAREAEARAREAEAQKTGETDGGIPLGLVGGGGVYPPGTLYPNGPGHRPNGGSSHGDPDARPTPRPTPQPEPSPPPTSGWVTPKQQPPNPNQQQSAGTRKGIQAPGSGIR
jgi:hypothetical protein